MHSAAEGGASFSTTPTTWSILLILIAVALLAMVLSSPHARRVLAGLMLGGIVLFFVVSVSWNQLSESPGEVATVRVSSPEQHDIPIGDVEMSATRPEASTKEPEWIHDKPGRHGDSYYAVVSSGELADPSMSKVNLDVKMAAAAERHVSDVLDQPNMAERLHIDPNYLRNSCIADEYVADDNGRSETFVRLKFDRRFDDEVKRRYKEHLSTSRVEKLGGATLGVLGVIAAALAYLRFTKPREAAIKRGD